MSRQIAETGPEHKNEPGEARREEIAREGKLLFTRYRERDCAFLIRGNRLLAMQVLSRGGSPVGAVYVGRVQKVVHSIEACFVQISESETGFLSLKHARRPIVFNRPFEPEKGDTLREGDELLVQIYSEAHKTKPFQLSAHITLTNEVAVLNIAHRSTVRYSQKLSEEAKERLKEWLSEAGIIRDNRLALGEELSVGMVVRTLAGDCEKEVFLQKLESLLTEFAALCRQGRHRTRFSCLREGESIYAEVTDKMIHPQEYQEVVTDDPKHFEALTRHCAQSLLHKPVRLYEDERLSLAKLYGLETKCSTAFERKIWLKSGGYLIIDPTEALTVIDVNTGKAGASKDAERHYQRVNQEAAEEVALQMRLRNLSGIIVVDFINMRSAGSQAELLRQMRRLLRQDRQAAEAVDITPLGLMEITRGRRGMSLAEQMRQESGSADKTPDAQRKDEESKMEFLHFEKVKDGKYLKNYELTYRNKKGGEKKYEIVSRRDLKGIEDVGGAPSGVSIVATCNDRLLLLHEFRMGVNRAIYNLCAGMFNEGETVEDCISRELYEETGLTVKRIKRILPPSFAAVAFSDTTTHIAFVEVEGEFEDHTSDNEEIAAKFYTRDEVRRLLKTESFSSRAQMAAYFFSEGYGDKSEE